MVNEVFDVVKVKQEFLQSVAAEYSKIFTERQLEMCLYMLDDFVNTLGANSLVLLRVEPELQQSPQLDPFQEQLAAQERAKEAYQLQLMQQQQMQQMQQPQMPIQPIPQRGEVQRQVQELNAQLPKKQATVDVDLTPDKSKSFAEKIREMRTGTKKPNRINPEDDN